MASREELKEVLRAALQQSGALDDVRARLRAEIALALTGESEAPPRSPETELLNALISEYLVFHEYRHSNAVFGAEARVGEISNRKELALKLGIEIRPKMENLPLLYALVFGEKRKAK